MIIVSRIIIPEKREYYTCDEISSIYKDKNTLVAFVKIKKDDRCVYIVAIFPWDKTIEESEVLYSLMHKLDEDKQHYKLIHGVNTWGEQPSIFLTGD